MTDEQGKVLYFLNIIDFSKPHTGWTSIPSATPGSMAYQISANSIEVFEKYEFLIWFEACDN